MNREAPPTRRRSGGRGDELLLRYEYVRRVGAGCATRPDQTEHRLTLREPGDARTDFLHDACDIVAEDDRKCSRALQPEQASAIAGGALHVDRIHGRRFDAHEDLPRPGGRHVGAAHGEPSGSDHAVQVSSLRMS